MTEAEALLGHLCSELVPNSFNSTRILPYMQLFKQMDAKRT